MKKTILSTAIIAAAFLAASCQKENLQENIAPEGSASVFTATIESGASTKTTVERIDGTPATYKTKWESGDKISINGVTYSATPDGTDATKATFTKVSEASNPTPTYKAYFPASLYNGTPTLPANIEETWAEGKYNMPMYAESETTALEFKNLCGVLKVTVTSGQLASVKSITVSSTNCATSGKFSVSDNKAVLTEASKTANTVTVTYTDAVSTDATGKVFYIAIPAQTYKNLSIAVSDGTTTKVMTTKKDQDITVARNTVYPISFDGTLIAGTAKREGDIDVRWVQLWENGPKFAEYNVGATSATEYGGYYTWGGSTDMSSSDFNRGSDPLSGNNDTAYKLWGSNWRMPTQAELDALRNPTKCTVKWTGAGLLCTGKGAYASNSVFLPAAGRYYVGNPEDQGNIGYYWSSTPDDSEQAYYLNFLSGEQDMVLGLRIGGCSVRAVLNETSLPKGALKGVFSVSGNKQVHFSKGNLVATINASGTPTAWKFAENQYDCLGEEGGANKTIGISAGDFDLFCWSTEAASNNWGIHTKTSSTSGYTDGNFKDWGTAIDDKGTWRTLTTAEWQYLFNSRSNASSLYKYVVTVCGKENCVVLLPDEWDTNVISLENFASISNYSEETSPKWSAMEAAGAVCLPAAGYRDGSTVDYVGDLGYYWSSTAYDSNDAYLVCFDSSDVYPDYHYYRYDGFSVRLITESK